ncbi:MAG: acetyl-CoA acetyltransferase [Deltaproteobacteria bacterium]|nr:acetyl-CoA acetyltransferase [Deltaproteobacteria bacterium]
MESIKDKVAIIGMGCTKFGENWNMDSKEMVIEAAYEAYEDAGIDPKDIQAAWMGTYMSGYTGAMIAEPLKLMYKPVTRVENMCATGSEALRNASYAVAAGVYDVVLAIGFEKLKDNGYSGLPDSELVGEWVLGKPDTYRLPTFSTPPQFALMANRYFAKYGIDPEEGRELLAKIAVKNHHNGTLSPKAHFQREITVEQALKAPMVAYPLGLYDCCGVSDGAAAAIVTRADMASSFRDDPIYIKALEIAQGPREGALNSEWGYTNMEETYRASIAAYKEAGITDPRREISIAEVHDCFSITEMTIYEDLQFSHRGKAKEDIEAGNFALDGELPINTDGGLKCFGHPLGASGLRMMYEVYKQLQEKAGQRQVKNPSIGLSHNIGGIPGSGVCSLIIAGN